MQVHSFTFNMFMENTYLIDDGEGSCAIVDPGCLFPEEQQQLADYMSANKLNPVALLNTHCHLDHIFGNAWVHRTYGLKPWIHADEKFLLDSLLQTAALYGIPKVEGSPDPEGYIKEGEPLQVGTTTLEVRLAPGHSPGHLILYHAETKQAIVGDVIFHDSIGRTDLPGGSYEVLMESIYQQIMTLPDDTQLYTGHGPATSVGRERQYNPFLN